MRLHRVRNFDSLFETLIGSGEEEGLDTEGLDTGETSNPCEHGKTDVKR